MPTGITVLKQDAIMRAIILNLQTLGGKEFMENAVQAHMDHTFSPPTDEELEFAVDRISAMLDQAIAIREGEMTLKRQPDALDRRMRGC
jgi:hypothetical protein